MTVIPNRGGTLALENVSHAFGATWVVAQVQFTVPEGELWTLLGPSGSGKSTLLRIIGGYIEPSHGRVMVNGRDITRVHARDRDMGMVFQDYALFPHMTVYDNVAYGLKARRVPERELRERVGQVLEINRLTSLERRYPHELSGGQQQRVALARALVIQPSALLMDEALGALDLKLRESMAVEIRRIQRELGTTTIHVTHDQSEAMTMSDRIVVLTGGRVAQIGTPEDLSRRPANRFVAEFMGSNNVVPITLLPGEDAVTFGMIDGVDGPLALSTHRPDGPASAKYFLVMRPSDTRVSTREPGIPGIVRATRYVGLSRCFVIETTAGATILAVDKDGRVQIGDRVCVSWLPEEATLVPEMSDIAE